MKKLLLTTFAGLSLLVANQASAWMFRVWNWSNAVQRVEARYAGCNRDVVLIGIGHYADFNAKECILNEITLHAPATAKPYTGPVQGTYTTFHIIGPVQGVYLVGRIEQIG